MTVEAGSTLTLSKEHFCEGKDGFYQMRHDLVRIVALAGQWKDQWRLFPDATLAFDLLDQFGIAGVPSLDRRVQPFQFAIP